MVKNRLINAYGDARMVATSILLWFTKCNTTRTKLTQQPRNHTAQRSRGGPNRTPCTVAHRTVPQPCSTPPPTAPPDSPLERTSTMSNDSLTRIVRQANPGGRTTYYIPDQFGMRRITRPVAYYLVNSGQAVWAGAPKERIGGPGAPRIGD